MTSLMHYSASAHQSQPNGHPRTNNNTSASNNTNNNSSSNNNNAASARQQQSSQPIKNKNRRLRHSTKHSAQNSSKSPNNNNNSGGHTNSTNTNTNTNKNKNNSITTKKYGNYKKLISHPMIASVSALLELLESDNCLVDVREGLQTFLIYVSNIIKHPREKKYRKIRIGNANYQIRLGHLVHGEALLLSIGYEVSAVNSHYLILPAALYSKPHDKHLIHAIRDLAMYKLEMVKKKFQKVPRFYEMNHSWVCVKHATEAHTIGRRQSMEDDHLLLDNFMARPDLGFFGLYDGHGGRRTVDFLTCAFYLNLSHYVEAHPQLSVLKALEDCYHITDKQIHRQQIYQSGATSVTVVIADNPHLANNHGGNSGHRLDLNHIAQHNHSSNSGIHAALHNSITNANANASASASANTNSSGLPSSASSASSTSTIDPQSTNTNNGNKSNNNRNTNMHKILYVANSGDTRCVLCRCGKAIRLTKDHKADDAEEAMLIRKRGGKIGRMKRVNGLLAVTRAFGDHLLKPPITVQPSVTQTELNLMNDYFVIIACDGVWDVMSDEEVIEYIYVQLMRRSGVNLFTQITKKDCQKYLHQICLDIVKNAIDRRSQDNISVMIVVF